MSEEQPHVLCECADGLAVVTLNRPQQRNAIGQQMIDEFHLILDGLHADTSLSAVIVHGAGGRAFAAGADIRLLLERKQHHAFAAINQSLFRRIEELPMPTIAAVTGYALGGGCELAMSCDLRIAGHGAKLGQPEVGLGIVPGAGGTQRLARLVGIARAKQMIFTGAIYDAAECHRIGLVNEVVADEQVLDRAKEIAAAIAKNSNLAVRLTKIAINSQFDIGPSGGFMIESVGQAILFEDDEKTRRMTDFVEKQDARRAEKAARQQQEASGE